MVRDLKREYDASIKVRLPQAFRSRDLKAVKLRPQEHEMGVHGQHYFQLGRELLTLAQQDERRRGRETDENSVDQDADAGRYEENLKHLQDIGLQRRMRIYSRDVYDNRYSNAASGSAALRRLSVEELNIVQDQLTARKEAARLVARTPRPYAR